LIFNLLKERFKNTKTKLPLQNEA